MVTHQTSSHPLSVNILLPPHPHMRRKGLLRLSLTIAVPSPPCISEAETITGSCSVKGVSIPPEPKTIAFNIPSRPLERWHLHFLNKQEGWHSYKLHSLSFCGQAAVLSMSNFTSIFSVFNEYKTSRLFLPWSEQWSLSVLVWRFMSRSNIKGKLLFKTNLTSRLKCHPVKGYCFFSSLPPVLSRLSFFSVFSLSCLDSYTKCIQEKNTVTDTRTSCFLLDSATGSQNLLKSNQGLNLFL